MGNEGSARIFQADCLGDRLRDRLNLDADPTSRNMALVFELLNNEFDVLRWNIKSDTDGPSRGRKYRCIDPNHFAPNVKVGPPEFPLFTGASI